MRRSVVAISTGALAGALGLGGLAYASTTGGVPGGSGTTPSTPASSSKATTGSPAKAHGGRLAILRRAVHVDAVLRGKDHTFHTWQLDRGLFTSLSTSANPARITITRADHVTVTAAVTATTKFRGIPESQLASGDRVLVVQRDGAARTVMSRAPAPAKGTTTSG